jgi:transcriptional regulator with XRE-family HTH domain
MVTVQELAEEVGIKPNYLNNIEGGYDQPGDGTAFRLAHALTDKLGRTITFDDFSDPIVLPRSPRQDNHHAA